MKRPAMGGGEQDPQAPGYMYVPSPQSAKFAQGAGRASRSDDAWALQVNRLEPVATLLQQVPQQRQQGACLQFDRFIHAMNQKRFTL